jgi:hypothetical protein
MQSQSCGRLCDTHWLIWIRRKRTARRHIAKAAVASADIAEQHERRRAARPTFANVGAGSFLAHSMQAQVRDQLLDARRLFLRSRRNQPRPRRLGGATSRPNT